MHGNPPQEVAGPLPTSADRSATKAVLPRNRGIPSVFDEDFAQQRAREPAPGEGVVGFEPLEAGRHVGEAGDRGGGGRGAGAPPPAAALRGGESRPWGSPAPAGPSGSRSRRGSPPAASSWTARRRAPL